MINKLIKYCKEYEAWSGRYKNIGYEIKKWFQSSEFTDSMEQGCTFIRRAYTGYICLNEVNNPEILKYYQEPKETCDYFLFVPAVLNNLPWHRGMAYYEPSWGLDHSRQNKRYLRLKVGHDYTTHWDGWGEYTDEYCFRDLKMIIDAYRSIYPEDKK